MWPMFFGCQSDSLYRFNLPIYDMCNNSLVSFNNCLGNAQWEIFKARQMVYQTPLFNFGGFIPYGSDMIGLPDSTSLLASMKKQLEQANAQLLQRLKNMSTNGTGNVPGAKEESGIKHDNMTAEELAKEKGYQERLELLVQMVTQLANDSSSPLTKAEKRNLKAALESYQKDKTTYEARYKELYKAYDKISNDKIKKYLAETETLTVDGTTGFISSLRSCGYEYNEPEGAIDSKLSLIKDEIAGLKDGKTDLANLKGVLSNSDNILDLLSSWNTEFKDGIGEGNDKAQGKRLVSYLALHYNKLNETNSKSNVEQTISSLRQALINKAKSVAKSEGLTEATKDNLTDLVAKLNAENIVSNKKVNTKFITAFDDLYLATRMASIAAVRYEVKERYNGIDSEVFNDELFKTATVEDLTGEGYEATTIENAAAEIEEIEEDDLGDREFDSADFDKMSIDEQVDYLTGENDDNKVYMEHIGDMSGMAYYREKGSKGRIFAKYNDELYVVQNRTVTVKEDGSLEAKDSGKVTIAKITPEQICKGKGPEGVSKAEKKPEDKKTEENSKETALILVDLKGLHGHTDDNEWNTTANAIQKDINSTNIFEVLANYEKMTSWPYDSNLLLQLMTEDNRAGVQSTKEKDKYNFKKWDVIGKQYLCTLLIDKAIQNLEKQPQTNEIKEDIEFLRAYSLKGKLTADKKYYTRSYLQENDKATINEVWRRLKKYFPQVNGNQATNALAANSKNTPSVGDAVQKAGHFI